MPPTVGLGAGSVMHMQRGSLSSFPGHQKDLEICVLKVIGKVKRAFLIRNRSGTEARFK